MTRNIKIAFIQRGWEDNLGTLWVSSVLRQQGFSVSIEVEDARTYRRLAAFSPGIIGYSCLSGKQQWVFSSIARLKDAGIKARVIIGGPHATFFPKLIENPLVDVICRGEGELAMLEYARALDEGTEPYGIKNLCFNLNGTIVRNEPRPLVEDLDALPFPDRSYYGKYRFLATNPYKIFISGRGCPFECSFCFNHALHQLYGHSATYVRRRSVENVIQELEEVLGQWGIKEARFSDDHFALDAGWLGTFASAYKARIKRPYTINARADCLDEARIAMLKESGCRLVCFGVETASEEARNRVLNKRITDEQIFQAGRLLKKYRIPFLTSNIIALPHETAEQAWKTVEFNQRLKTDLPWFSLMQYYPGTGIYAYAKEHGLLDERYNAERIGGYFGHTYLAQENAGELENIHALSILATRVPFLLPLCKYLAKKCRPTILFRLIFKATYLHLTLERAHLGIWRLIRWGRYYRKSI